MQNSWESKRNEIDAGRMSRMLENTLRGAASGAVHSCFKASLNIWLAGRLVHVGGVARPLCCFGIQLTEKTVGELLNAVRPGDQVTLRHEKLTFYGRSQILAVETGSFERVDLRIPGPGSGQRVEPPLVENPPLEETWLWRLLRDMDFTGHLGLDPSGEFSESCKALVAWNGLELPDEAVRFLAGRGRGLTPGGDDILVGYGAGLWAFEKRQIARGFAAAVNRAVMGRTTDVSLAYFDALEAGCANENMVRLLEQAPRGYGTTLRWLEDVRSVGHTSGWDTLYGLRLALARGILQGKQQ